MPPRELAAFAKKMHFLWRLECCTPEEMAPWLAKAKEEAQQKRDGSKRVKLVRSTFCADCEPSWRKGHELDNTCVTARREALTPPPEEA